MMKKNKLDEMQEQKLLKIEHNGMWIAFWGLLAAILFQTIFEKGNFTGEWIVFMVMSLYTLFACIKNGIWDRRLEPNLKTNLLISIIPSAIVGILIGVSSYLKYHKSTGSIGAGIFTAIFIFILSFGSLSLFSALYKKRHEKLELEGEKEA